jgi:molybdopterin-guanine dinucleotide biosynthesis protein A
LPERTVAGVVIAGGRSTRFGGEKAAARLGGRPLLLWATARLQRSCADVAVNARAGSQAEALAAAARLPVLRDLPGDAAGPLAGVRVALAWAAESGFRAIAVSPCDAPLLPADLFARLIAAAGSGAAMAETPNGAQPLCAVWPAAALARVSEALEDGAHPPLWQVLDSLGAVRVQFVNSAAFVNINTREDLASLAARWRGL